MDKEKVLNLARLSRIYITDLEAESLSHEFEGILDYVGEIKKAEGSDTEITGEFTLKNIMRTDEISNIPGTITEVVLKNAPSSKDNYIKVKNIL